MYVFLCVCRYKICVARENVYVARVKKEKKNKKMVEKKLNATRACGAIWPTPRNKYNNNKATLKRKLSLSPSSHSSALCPHPQSLSVCQHRQQCGA